MENLYVTFEVTVRDDKYKYDPGGDGELTIQLPRHILEVIDISSLFNHVLEVALADYDAKKKGEDDGTGVS